MNINANEDTFQWIQNLPNNGYNAIITDPPYDMEREAISWLHKQFLRVCSGTIIVFSPPENQWIAPADQYGFWIKPISTKNTSKRYSRFVEMIFIYCGEDSVWNTGRHWSQYTNVFTDLVDNSKLHPFRKPPALIERLIQNHTLSGDYILDPFAGSFVVSEVGKRTGRNVIANEIDKNLYQSWIDKDFMLDTDVFIEQEDQLIFQEKYERS